MKRALVYNTSRGIYELGFTCKSSFSKRRRKEGGKKQRGRLLLEVHTLVAIDLSSLQKATLLHCLATTKRKERKKVEIGVVYNACFCYLVDKCTGSARGVTQLSLSLSLKVRYSTVDVYLHSNIKRLSLRFHSSWLLPI